MHLGPWRIAPGPLGDVGAIPGPRIAPGPLGQDCNRAAESRPYIDTFTTSKMNETLNKMRQLSVIFTTQVFIAVKMTTQIDSLCSAHHYSGLDQVSIKEKPAVKAIQTCILSKLEVEDLIAASVYDKYSVGPSIRPICPRCCFTMKSIIPVCSNFRAQVSITNTCQDEIWHAPSSPLERVRGSVSRRE